MEDYAEDVRAYYCIAKALKNKKIYSLFIVSYDRKFIHSFIR